MKLSKHPQFGRAVSFATGQIVQYCFDEEDLFPERDYGILGLLDDAYLIHRFVSMLQEMYSHVGMDDAKYRLPEKPIFELVQTVLPAGVCDALDRTCYNLIQVANTLFASGAREGGTSFESFATLRIDEAISILTRKVNGEGT